MEETAHEIPPADTLEAWQQALAEVSPTPALSGALLRRRDDLFGRFAAWYGRLRRRPRAERRRWQRQLGLSLAGIALLLAVNGAPAGAIAPAATITVDGATCTLADAITAANTNTATGGCSAGSAGADTLNLIANIGLTAALPAITTPITIEGNGNTISRTSGAFRILTVTSGGNLTLNNATVSGGAASGGFPTGYGGGIYASSAMLTVNDSVLSNNSATGQGGGILAWGATVTVSNSTISSNSANGRGGGIGGIGSPRITIVGSNISNNSATQSGGGIDLSTGTLTASNSTISSNSTSTSGGGIYAFSASLAISNSSILTNTASISGGGIGAFLSRMELMNSTVSGNLASTGGGIRPANSSDAISNSTASGNSAVYGGGIYSFGPGTVTVSNSTISGDSGGVGGGIRAGNSATVVVLSSIVAHQTAGADCSNGATLASGGYNIESGTSCGFTGTGDLQNQNAAAVALGALANNGGPTQTRALGAGSVAIDRIPIGTNGCVSGTSTDQRGAPRAGGAGNGGAACDVGAYEAGSTPLAVTLASFDAQAMIDHILLSWETVSEINNSGFNLYRSASPAGPDALLAFVPSQAPGSTVGASYTFTDGQVAPGQTWYYWLEDVDLGGATSLHGPVSATLQAPTAVTVAALQAQAATPAVTPWGALVASLLAAAGALAARRRWQAP